MDKALADIMSRRDHGDLAEVENYSNQLNDGTSKSDDENSNENEYGQLNDSISNGGDARLNDCIS